MLGLDYAGGRPSAAAIAAAGFDFAVRYLSSGGPALPGKLLTSDEADDLRANGVDIVSNWETTADRMLDGYQAGVDDATAALAHVLACGGRKDRPIYFSADMDTTPEQQCMIDDYLRGAASVLGVEQVGIYGGYWSVSRALDHGTARWAWQTDAWSGGNLDPRANIHQRIGFVWVDGVECDQNQALTADFGQWSAHGKENLMSATDDMTADIHEQLCGEGSRDPGQYTGWPQLSGRTVVDALALIGQTLGIPGFSAPKTQ